MEKTQRYWTEGKIVNGKNVGGGVLAERPVATTANKNTVNVVGYKDNPDGTTTNFLSDGTQDTGKLTKNTDGSYSFSPLNNTVAPKVDRTPVVSAYQQSLNDAASIDREAILEKNKTYAATQRQSRIDAIKSVFAPRIKREEEEANARLSRIAALNFKSGVTGSGVDTTKIGEQTDLNKKSMQALDDVQQQMIQEAFDKADVLARQLTEEEFSAKKSTAEAKVVAEKNKLDTAKDVIKSFGAANTTLDSLKEADPKTYNNLIATGMSDFEISNLLKASNPQAKVIETKVVGNNIVTVSQIGNKTVVETHKTDIQPQEEFKSVDGVGYGVTTLPDGTLNLRKLTGSSDTETSGSSNFIDIMQQNIDAGFSPEVAAREAAALSEKSGLPVDQKTLASWTQQARTLTKKQVPEPVGAETTPSKLGQDVADVLRNSGAGSDSLQTASSFWGNLFGQ